MAKARKRLLFREYDVFSDGTGNSVLRSFICQNDRRFRAGNLLAQPFL
jgi:hypothetical protein